MKISLCIIARNEESMLPGCLDSVRGLVDEIVLVDTGSRDATIRIAEKHGARVFKSPWRDDFSAPRNLAVARARGDWILQLDADERLAPSAAAAIRRAVEEADFDCGLIRLHNVSKPDADAASVISGKERLGEPMSLPRLLRRTSDLKYEGIVHESVARWLTARGSRVRFVDADILHLGSLPEVRRERDKVTRNVDLLKKRAAEEPDDPTALSYIAFEALAASKLDEAGVAAEDGWRVMLRGRFPKGTSVLRLAVARSLVQKERGDHHGVLETVRVGERLDGEHPDFFMLRGMSHEMLGLAAPRGSKLRRSHLEAAAEAHRGALALANVDYVQRFLLGAGSFGSRIRLATVLLQLGDAVTARDELTKALAQRPGDPEASLAFAEAEIALGGAERALGILEPLLGERPDGWVLAALACDTLGALDDALAFVRQASQRTKNGYVGPHRKDTHLDLMALAGAYAGLPSPGPGPIGALTAMMARAPWEGEPRGSISDLRVPSLVANLVQAGRIESLDALLTPRAESAFPGLAAAVTDALAALGVTVERDDAPTPILVATDLPAAASVVSRVLAGHPRLRDRGEMESPASASKGEDVREIFVTASIARAIGLAKDLARATLLFVAADEPSPERCAEIAGDVGARVVGLGYRALLDAPVATLSTLLARLGEPTDDGPLRSLIEHYPGRDRAFASPGAEGRGPRATRPEAETAPMNPAREVSP
jgi:tetratricopeptide (TPR) repeat protein